jgi:hypothetical protein
MGFHTSGQWGWSWQGNGAQAGNGGELAMGGSWQWRGGARCAGPGLLLLLLFKLVVIKTSGPGLASSGLRLI